MDKVIENVDYYLAVLPERTQNGEPYGINMMPCNRSEWRVCYYSHYSKNYDDRFGVIVKNTLPEALHAMYQLMLETCPAILKEPPTTPATSWEEVFKSAFEKEREYYMDSIRDILNERTPNHAAFDLLFTFLFERIYYNTSRHWPVSPTPMSETWEDLDKWEMSADNEIREKIKDLAPGDKRRILFLECKIDKFRELLMSRFPSAPSLHQVDRWVRVEEHDKLPLSGQTQWCYGTYGSMHPNAKPQVFEGYYNASTEMWSTTSHDTAIVTHHQPKLLPTPPKQ